LKEYTKFTIGNDTYSISLEQKVAKDRIRFAVPKSLFITICRSISRSTENTISFFNLEHNALFYVRFDKPNVFVFEHMKMLNFDSSGVFRKIEIPVFEKKDPVYFKSYVSGEKIFIDRKISLLMKKLNVEPQEISFENIRLKNGFYSTFFPNDNNLIIDFFVENGDFYITEIIKPNLLKFGIFSFQN
jgi:hypothetical protein